MSLEIVATCALGLEEFLERELRELGADEVRAQKGAVSYRGGWEDVWRSNWRLRTANRVLVVLDRWPAESGDALAAGAGQVVKEAGRAWGGLESAALFQPHRTISIRATCSGSVVTDSRWAALRVKDGLVDSQRERTGRRSSVDRRDADLPLRLWLHRDQATLLLDTSGRPLDRRGYRAQTTTAPVREQIAAACVLASGWSGEGPVVDPMCGSGTFLVEAAWIARGIAPGSLRTAWAFERLPNYAERRFAAIRAEPIPGAAAETLLVGVDRSAEAIAAARANLRAARLDGRLRRGDGFALEPPAGPGLVIVNPPYGERLGSSKEEWKRLGDLFKQRYTGWSAVVLAGGADRGKHIGLKPRRRIPVRHGPLDARILPFHLY